jgi:hypothetical protein
MNRTLTNVEVEILCFAYTSCDVVLDSGSFRMLMRSCVSTKSSQLRKI